MPPARFPYLARDRDRHGNLRVYLRRNGAKIRIHAAEGSPEFEAEYLAAIERTTPAARQAAQRQAGVSDPLARPIPGTLRALSVQYMASAEFGRLAPSTQADRRRILGAVWREPRAPGAQEVFGDMPVRYLTPEAITVLRDRKAHLPAASADRLKVLRAMLRWARGRAATGIVTDPSAGVERLHYVSQGHRTWDEEAVRAYEARWPIGSRPRLALAILLYTGVRISDLARLGRQHVRRGPGGPELHFRPYKGRTRRPQDLTLALLPELADVIEQSPTGDLTWLVTESGRPYTIKGLGNAFRDWCDAAGLQGLSAHGLRKAGATRLAEGGATAHQLMAVFGWRSLAEAELYTRAASQRRMAADTIHLLSRRRPA